LPSDGNPPEMVGVDDPAVACQALDSIDQPEENADDD
jgi:hypothetical protein